MDEPEILSQVYNFTFTPGPLDEACLAVCKAHFDWNYMLVARQQLGLAIYRVSNAGTVEEYPAPPIMGNFAREMFPEAAWRLCVDSRNNVYIIACRQKRLNVLFLPYRAYSDAAWMRSFLTTGQWTSFGAAADRELFLAASLEGETVIKETAYLDHSIVVCLTATNEVLFHHKVLLEDVAVTMRPDPDANFYVVGMGLGGEIVAHSFSKTGAIGVVAPTSGLAVASVSDACLTRSGILAVTGDVKVDGVMQVYHVTIVPRTDGEVCRVALVPVNEREHRSELVEIYDQTIPRCVLLLQVADRGTWIFDGDRAIHHFSDEITPGQPQLQVHTNLENAVVLWKAGTMHGDLLVDRKLYDAGAVTPLAYCMRFVSAQLQPMVEVVSEAEASLMPS